MVGLFAFQGSFRIVSFVYSFLFRPLGSAFASSNEKLGKTTFETFLVSYPRGLAVTHGQV